VEVSSFGTTVAFDQVFCHARRMVEPISEFESGRGFQVWHYSVSHAQLLLRSNRNDQVLPQQQSLR
jgi:hypothetical protein